MNIRTLVVAFAAAAMLVLTGCGSDTDAGGSGDSVAAESEAPDSSPTEEAAEGEATEAAPEAESVTIIIEDFEYQVPESVAPGTEITVINKDSATHTVTNEAKGAFDVTVDGGGGKATFTAPTTPGSFGIICTFHANMSATLVVE